MPAWGISLPEGLCYPPPRVFLACLHRMWSLGRDQNSTVRPSKHGVGGVFREHLKALWDQARSTESGSQGVRWRAAQGSQTGGTWVQSRQGDRDLPGGCICPAGTLLYSGYLGCAAGDHVGQRLGQALLGATTGTQGTGPWRLAVLPTVCARGFAWSPRREEGRRRREGGGGRRKSLGKKREAEAPEPEPGRGCHWYSGRRGVPSRWRHRGPTPWHQAAHSSSTALAEGPYGSQQRLCLGHGFA